MRIIFLSFHLPLPDEPGAFRPWMEARLMRDLGCTVTVITSAIQYMTGEDLRRGHSGWCIEEQREGIRILRVWGLRHYRVNLWRRVFHYLIYAVLAGLAGLLRGGSADRVFVGTDPIFVMPIARILTLFKNAALVLDERDLYPETALALGVLHPGFVVRVISAWQRSMRRKSRHILAATPGIRGRMVDLGIPVSRVRVLYNADTDLMNRPISNHAQADSLQLLNRYAPRGAAFIVVYAGGMGRANDVGTLLNAAQILRDEHDIAFILAGDGERRREYEQRIHAAGLNAVMTGPLPRETARQLISVASVCACAHRYIKQPLFPGALASKTLDYLALGKPVVFCGEGDTVDVIRESHGGICCSPGDAQGMADAFRWLNEHRDERLRMAESAHKWFAEKLGIKAAMATMAWALDVERTI